LPVSYPTENQTEPPLNAPENRENTAEIMFESFNVQGLWVIPPVPPKKPRFVRVLTAMMVILSTGTLQYKPCWRSQRRGLRPK
jgi:hypothetical protein